jgi:hypothetical protein
MLLQKCVPQDLIRTSLPKPGKFSIGAIEKCIAGGRVVAHNGRPDKYCEQPLTTDTVEKLVNLDGRFSL